MKLQNPFGNGKTIWITQTYHAGGNNIAIDCITDNTNSNTPVYAISSGTVTMISAGAGSYLCKTVDGAGFQEFYVHTARWTVANGQHVNVGDQIGYIATKAENGGYPMHLHMGLSTGNYIMNYFDRGINFKTTYQDIANDWFNGDINNPINWGLFQDLNIGDSYSKGDRIVFTGEQNIRVGSGLKYNVESSTYSGMKATIIENSRVADGYVWYNIQVDGGGTGWVADVNKFTHYTENENSSNNTGSDNNIPSDMELLQSLKQELEQVKAENKELKNNLRGAIAQGEVDHTLYVEYKEANEELAKDNELLSKDNEELKKTLSEQNAEISKHNDELTIANATILDLQEKLSKGGNIDNYTTTQLLKEIVKRVFS